MSKITPAEREALEAVLQHGTVKEAAAAIGKSPRTVEQQLATARQRHDVTTTIELIRVVVVEPPTPESISVNHTDTTTRF